MLLYTRTADFKMAFEELLVIMLLFWLHLGAASGGGELGDAEHRNYRDSITQ